MRSSQAICGSSCLLLVDWCVMVGVCCFAGLNCASVAVKLVFTVHGMEVSCYVFLLLACYLVRVVSFVRSLI